METMVNEVEEVKYVIKVNGKVVSITYPSRVLAEAAIAHLAPGDQELAEVAPVTAGGQDILLG